MSELVLIWLVLLCVLWAGPAAAKYPDDLPPAEKEIAGSVDPWGLAFSDSLRAFEARFAPESRFAVGVAHDLVKIWLNKYWFRGPSVSAQAAPTPVLEMAPQWAAAGETVAFQIVILPRLGAPEATYRLQAHIEGPAGVTAEIFREIFVKTAPPGYPRYPVERWPDPLVPSQEVRLAGLDCGVFWIDVHLAANLPAGLLKIHVEVTDGEQKAAVVAPFRVVSGLNLRPKDFPLVAWFRPRYGSKTLSTQQMLDMARLVLAHHMQAMDILVGRFKPEDPSEFDAIHDELARLGQNVFELERPSNKFDYKLLYEHVQAKGWLEQALVYSNVDEPLRETFYAQNVPFFQDFKQKYPGLKVFLASAYHPQMEKGCDIWMTDLSTEGYDPEAMRDLKQPILWHYYCHLPIHVQFRAPLTMAPNMEVDNEALQHRLALWMSHYYGAKGVFIWAGFVAGGLKDDFWQTLELEQTPGNYPYGGIHNGNNFLVYPPLTEGGAVLPSLRLKVLRAGMQDLAIMRAAQALLKAGKIKGARAQKLQALLNPVPAVFVHPHYWDRLPETLLKRRAEILATLAEAK